MKKISIAVIASFLAGCVSFGIECRHESTHAWVKVRRMAFAPSKGTTDNLANFREKVCR